MTRNANRGFGTCLAGLAAVAALVSVPAGTAQAQARQRITQSVDNQRLVHLRGTTHPLATVANDRGRVAAGLAMDRILLVLQSSPEQETALEQLLAEQQDPSSPHYHEWLTPQQFGERFGASQQDLDVIANWLQDRGFRVNSVAEGRRSIEFSGTARQVEDAFQTEIHNYEVNGERHVANAVGHRHSRGPARRWWAASSRCTISRCIPCIIAWPRWSGRRLSPPAPATTSGPGTLPPSTTSPRCGTGNYDGTGQTIAIPGHTNIKLSDVTAFRGYFGLPANNPQIVLNGADPGIISADEETEADLDVEWSGAVAKGATVKFVVSKSTRSTDGVDLSNQYIVNNNLASVMSLSFGACEAQLGTAGNAFYNSLWSQAAAQGISVFVAAGDTGSAGCDVPAAYDSKGNNITQPASGGLAVNGLASTPYNVAVGGTEFSDASGGYWNLSNGCDAPRLGDWSHPGGGLAGEQLHHTRGQRQQPLCRIGRRQQRLRHARLADRPWCAFG